MPSTDSIKAAAKDVAFDVMAYYKGNQTGRPVGLIDYPPPNGDYYWWTNAALWSTMIDYWHYTGDDTYNTLAVEALTAQNGGDLDHAFFPANWSTTISNDDNGLWAMAAMQAAELGFPSAPQGQPSWIELAKSVFDTLAARYSREETPETCNGGLRWQIVPVNTGYSHKATVSSAVFLNLGARLARYTGNQTYGEWADKVWDWLSGVGFVDDEFNVWDGASVDSNCSDHSNLQFSYAPGVLIQGAAYMYNHTTDTAAQKTWADRLTGLVGRTLAVFSPNGTLVEVACELPAATTCKSDLLFFKGIALRSLASAAVLAPSLQLQSSSDSSVAESLRNTAETVVDQVCVGDGDDDDGGENENGNGDGNECGFRWREPFLTEDRNGLGIGTGVPRELNALSAILGMLRDEVAGKALVTEATAGSGGDGGDSGSGSGSGTGTGNGDGGEGGSAGDGSDDENAGVSMRVGMGLLLAGVFAALI